MIVICILLHFLLAKLPPDYCPMSRKTLLKTSRTPLRDTLPDLNHICQRYASNVQPHSRAIQYPRLLLFTFVVVVGGRAAPSGVERLKKVREDKAEYDQHRERDQIWQCKYRQALRPRTLLLPDVLAAQTLPEGDPSA